MKKLIYHGLNKGLYEYSNFKTFLEKQGEKVLETYSRYPSHQVYNIQDITLLREHDSTSNPNSVKVTLTGDKDKISKVERIILEEARKY